MKYKEIVFMQGDDAIEPLKILDEKGYDAVLEYLNQWDYDEGQINDLPSHGTSDDVYQTKDGLVLSYNNSLGYIGLEKIV